MSTQAETEVTLKARAPLTAYIALGIAVLAIAFAAILIRYAQAAGAPSILIAAARLVTAAAVLTPMAWRNYREYLIKIKARDISLAFLGGIFLALHFTSWIISLEHTTVLISVVLVTTSPIWVGLMEFFLLRTKLSQLIIAGLVITVVGGFIIGLPGEGSGAPAGGNVLLGSGLALVGAIAVGVYFIIGRKLREDLPLVPYIWLVYTCGAIVMSGVMLISQIPVTGYTPSAYLLLIAVGLIPQLIGHSSLNFALGYLPATYVSLSTQLEPIGSAILALILLGEVPVSQQIIGSGIILIGVTIATIGQSRK